MFAQLVRPNAVLDFKVRIWELVARYSNDAIRVGTHWFYYDFPGNFFFGFIGTWAGFTRQELHNGAGLVQLMVDAVRVWQEYALTEIPGLQETLQGLLDLITYRGDQASDYWGIEAGIDFALRGGSISDLRQTVDRYASLVGTRQSEAWAYGQPPPNNWPYEIGAFRGPSNPIPCWKGMFPSFCR